jgi:hypothetical protein
VGRQRLIQHCLLALGVNENDADPTLREILEHFTISELMTAYKESQSPKKHNAMLAFYLMDIIEEYDPSWSFILTYPYPEGLQAVQSEQLLSTEERKYYQTLVVNLLSASQETVEHSAKTLAEQASSLPAIVGALGRQFVLKVFLHCYGFQEEMRPYFDQLLVDFSIPQLVDAYLDWVKSADQKDLLANEPDFDDKLHSVHMLRSLFWLLEQKDPAFKWAYWVKTPKYPLYDPWTHDYLNPQTGESVPLD